MSSGLGNVVGFGIGFEPGKQAALLVAALRSEGRDEDDVPLEALCAVDGGEVDGAFGRRRRGVELGEACGEGGELDGALAGWGLGLELVQQLEVAGDVLRLLRVGVEVGVEAAPGALDGARQGLARALSREGGEEDRPEGLEAGDGVGRKEVAAGGDEVEDGSLAERFGFVFGLRRCEPVEVGEGEADPGSAQEREPGGAVGGVQEGAGESEQVQDFAALAERLYVDGAIGDRRARF